MSNFAEPICLPLAWGNIRRRLRVAQQGTLAKVMRVEIDSPDEFSKLRSKQAIIEKLEEKAGPEARKLFEKFVRNMEKLLEQQQHDNRCHVTALHK
jgi:hypothetical protein